MIDSMFRLMVVTIAAMINPIENSDDELVASVRTALANRLQDLRNITMEIQLDEVVTPPQEDWVPQSPAVTGKFSSTGELDLLLAKREIGFPWMDVLVKIDGDRRYAEIKIPPLGEFSSKRSSSMTAPSEVRSWNGQKAMNLRGLGGSIALNSSNREFGNPLFKLLGHATDAAQLEAERHQFLPTCFDWSNVEVLSPSVQVAGLESVCLRSGADTIWVAVANGGALTKRTIHSTSEEAKVDLTTGGWQEVNGTWLPRQIEKVLEVSGSAPITIAVHASVKYSSLPLPDNAFEIQFPPNSRVADQESGRTLHRLSNGQWAHEALLERDSGSSWRVSLVVINFLLLGIGCVVYLVKRSVARKRLGK